MSSTRSKFKEIFVYLLLYLFGIAVAQDNEICGENSYFTTKCEEICDRPTCSSIYYQPKVWGCDNCTGCACNSGYLYDQDLKKCVLPEECKLIGNCSKNETFLFCKTCSGFQRSCDYLETDVLFPCRDGCFVGCFCSEGYVLDRKHKNCISISDC